MYTLLFFFFLFFCVCYKLQEGGMKKCVHARYPEERPAPLRPPSVTGPAEWTTEASWWDLSYKRACCRAQAPWHDGSARPGIETARWSGFLSAFIISLPTEGKKSFWGCERASSWQHVTYSSYMAPRYVFIFVAAVVVVVAFLFFSSSWKNQELRQETGVGDLGHARETNVRGGKTNGKNAAVFAFSSPDKKQPWGKMGDENRNCWFTICHVTLDCPVHKHTHTQISKCH